MVGTIVQDGRRSALHRDVQATTVSSAPQPAPSQITQRIRDRAAATRPQAAEGSMRPAEPVRRAPQEILDTRTENGVPAWKRRIVDELSTELDRRGASRGTRASDRLTAENVDARITSLSQEIRSRNRAGYEPRGASRIGVVVNRVV